MRLTLFRSCQLYATGVSASAPTVAVVAAPLLEPLQQLEGESTHSPKSLGNDDSDDSEGSASDCDTTRMSYDASTSSSDLLSLGCAALVTCPSTISINNNEYESSYFSFPESRSFDLTYTDEEEEVSQAVEDDSDSPSEVSSTSTSYYNTICNVFGYFTSKSSNTNVENVKATPAAVTADAITPEHASLRDSGYGDGGRTLIPHRISKKRISKPIVGPVTASLMHSGLAHPRKLPRRLTLDKRSDEEMLAWSTPTILSTTDKWRQEFPYIPPQYKSSEYFRKLKQEYMAEGGLS